MNKYDELVSKNPLTLKQRERKKHLEALWALREEMRVTHNVVQSVNQVNQEIEFTQFAIASESSSQLAKVAIFASVLAVVVAVVGLF
tara:strand:+ start:323 stop:583 length:261 start_codon:yes stop_codon:yes gene_type:complete